MDSFKDIAEAFLNAVKSDTDTHTSIKGEIIKNSESSFSLLTPDHIQYAVNGRGPGKMPPLEEMLNLVNSKNIIFEGLDKRGTAFAIGMAIKHNGTKNWKPGAPNFMEETVKKYQKEYEEDLGKIISVDIDDKLKDEYAKIWAEQEKVFKDFKI